MNIPFVVGHPSLVVFTMGRTLPSFTQLIINEQNALTKFRRALRQEDQRAFDDLFRAARYHVAAAAYASHLLPFETMLLAMLIEEHKRVQHLQVLLERLLAAVPEGESEAVMRFLVEGGSHNDGVFDIQLPVKNQHPP